MFRGDFYMLLCKHMRNSEQTDSGRPRCSGMPVQLPRDSADSCHPAHTDVLPLCVLYRLRFCELPWWRLTAYPWTRDMGTACDLRLIDSLWFFFLASTVWDLCKAGDQVSYQMCPAIFLLFDIIYAFFVRMSSSETQGGEAAFLIQWILSWNVHHTPSTVRTRGNLM